MKPFFLVLFVISTFIIGCQKPSEEKRYTYISAPGVQLQKVHYEVMGELAITEEDIILGTLEEVEARRVQIERGTGESKMWGAVSKRESGFLWDRGRVYYDLDSGFAKRGRILDAMRYIQKQARVSFIPRTSEKDYIRFIDGEGCSSHVGRKGGVQTLTLGETCSTGSTIHELLHSLGVWHEQSRKDRNKFIVVHLDNVKAGKEHNFEIQSDQKTWGPYDFASIMHYSAKAFSKNGSRTITRVNGGSTDEMGQRNGMSAYDVEGLQSLYGD